MRAGVHTPPSNPGGRPCRRIRFRQTPQTADIRSNGAQSKQSRRRAHEAFITARLFRRHMGWRTHHRSGTGLRWGPRVLGPMVNTKGGERQRQTAGGFNPQGRAQYFGQTPINHLNLPKLTHHHIVRFQISVKQSLGMCASQGLRNLSEYANETIQAVAHAVALMKHALLSVPFNTFHRGIKDISRQPANLIHRGHAGILELAGDFRLFDERPDQVGAALMLVAQDLDADKAGHIRCIPQPDGFAMFQV